VPRGVAIPDVRERLFEAAERVLEREGPAGVSGRAVTREAGCATGLLYNHFGDFDQFVTQFVLDRFRRAAASAPDLPERAGTRTVAGNITAAALMLFESNLLTLVSLVTIRPASIGNQASRRRGEPRVGMLRRAFVDYLDAEKELGRVIPDADTDALATAFIAIIHHLLVTHSRDDPDVVRRRLRRVIKALIAGITPAVAC
jgi:AcrR family transcriptional regulator